MTRPDDGNWRMLSARERAYLEALEARCDRLELELGRICIEALQNHWEGLTRAGHLQESRKEPCERCGAMSSIHLTLCVDCLALLPRAPAPEEP